MTDSPHIPNTFHFIFGLRPQKEPFHLAYYLCLASCLNVNRPDCVFFHYYHEPYGRYWDMIRERLHLEKAAPVELVNRFRYSDKFIEKHFTYAHHADFIRLESLLERGGVYADIDTLFVSPYPQELFTKPFVLGREDPIRCAKTGETKRSLCNALILSCVDAPFCRLWLEKMAEAFDGTWSNHSTVLPQLLSEQHPEWLHIEPSRSFYPYMWTPLDLHRLLEGCETGTEGIYSIHLWAHLWWAKSRKDFSTFHAGRLTENFIRKVDTTYNLLARPHLPPAEKTSLFFDFSKIRAILARKHRAPPAGQRLT